MRIYSTIAAAFLILAGCDQQKSTEAGKSDSTDHNFEYMYKTVPLTTDLGKLTDKEKSMIPVLMEAASIIDSIFWIEAFGDKDEFLSTVHDQKLRQFAEINYGPWDRLNNNMPFIPGFRQKPAGANFYPADMTREEFDRFESEDKTSQYTIIRRDDSGKLISVPYYKFFSEWVPAISNLLGQAADLAEDPGLKNYLNLRSAALLNDQYRESDIAWMKMKDNTIDIVIGPIETYEDGLFGYKAAHEAFVLVKDKEWSRRLDKFIAFLPELQDSLPVPAEYKKEKPGSGSDLNAYDVIYYAGEANSGGKTIAINLPNDESIQSSVGTRRLQLKNAMKAKFDHILMPIAGKLISKEQVDLITFDAFFANTMFHEVAHGLGVKYTINQKAPVRAELKEHFSAIEEGKADILGLYMVKKLHEKGELGGELVQYYTTFLAGILRSVRFGASEAHGKANMICFNYFKDEGAFSYDPENGTYEVNFRNMDRAIGGLTAKLLILQGNGDYDGAGRLITEKGVIGDELAMDLERLRHAGIPVDIVFEQGMEVLGYIKKVI
ncbi:MAG TPA: hypothetical protein VI583_12170 [Cyclobacteriaceae bacterium]|nr:hypothetical protein [Cyclobacteriaceae bacterium]